MSYRIDYGPDTAGLREESKSSGTLVLMTLTVFVLFLSVLRSNCPDIWVNLTQWLWPDDAEVTKNAATVLLAALRSGQPVAEAAAAFCREILLHAGFR